MARHTKWEKPEEGDVKGHPSLKRDVQGVIQNTNARERSSYRIAKQHARNNMETTNELLHLKRQVKELADVKEELSELKGMLAELLKKNI